MIRRALGVCTLAVSLTAGCLGQDQRANSPDTASPAGNQDSVAASTSLPADAALDQILDVMDQRGRDLRDLSAKVTLTDTDAALGDETARIGRFSLSNSGDGGTRARVLFDKKRSGERTVEEKIEYVLDGGKLIDRNYTRKLQVTRTVLRPGEKMNLLKLGEGPFPLPIGQKRQDVYQNFDVKKVEPKQDDPPETLHVALTPKPQTSLARKFKTIDVWVNRQSGLPQRIQTMDPNEVTVRTTDLEDLKINAGVPDTDFSLSPIDASWTQVDEAYQGDGDARGR